MCFGRTTVGNRAGQSLAGSGNSSQAAETGVFVESPITRMPVRLRLAAIRGGRTQQREFGLVSLVAVRSTGGHGHSMPGGCITGS